MESNRDRGGRYVGRPLDSSVRTELCDPQQIIGGADQVGGEGGPRHTPIARTVEAPNRLDPAEDLFHALAYSLADCVSRPTGGA
jgi:hypothetical protein